MVEKTRAGFVGFLSYILVITLIWFLAACQDVASTGTQSVRLPLFSDTSAWHVDAFDLTLNCLAGETIYYTVDGSLPDPSHVGADASDPSTAAVTYIYTGPIRLADPTGTVAPLSLIPTSAVPEGIWGEPFGWWGGPWLAPLATVNQGVVVRAVVMRDEQVLVPLETHTYWIGTKPVADSLPVLSLSTDAGNLFDYHTGILVPGYSYDNRLPVDAFAYTYGNYAYSGALWERFVNIEYFDETLGCQLNTTAGVRVGGQARGMPIHALDFYLRSEYGSHKNTYDIFRDQRPPQKRLKLRAGGSQWCGIFISDEMFQLLAAAAGLDTQRWQPAVLYINGEYWGLYNLRDMYDDNYLQEKYGYDDVQVADIDFFANTEYDSGDGVAYNALLEGLLDRTDQLASELDETGLKWAEGLMDIANFIDYYAVMIAGNCQVYPNSHNDKRWRLRTPVDNRPGFDGRWRWMVIDGDIFMANTGVDKDRVVAFFSNYYGPARYLVRNEAFRIAFLNRLADLMNTIFNPDYALPLLKSRVAQVENEVTFHQDRWGGYLSGLKSCMNIIYDNLKIRYAGSQPQLAAARYFNENGADYGGSMDIPGIARLTVRVNDLAGGHVRVNRLELEPGLPAASAAVYPWTGTYFQNIPVPLTAIPAQGYHFVAWVGADGTSASTTVTMTGDTAVTAIFAADD